MASDHERQGNGPLHPRQSLSVVRDWAWRQLGLFGSNMRNGSKSRACGSPIDWQLHSVGRLLFLIVMRMVSCRLLQWIHRAGLSRVFFERLLLSRSATVTTTVTRRAPPERRILYPYPYGYRVAPRLESQDTISMGTSQLQDTDWRNRVNTKTALREGGRVRNIWLLALHCHVHEAQEARLG